MTSELLNNLKLKGGINYGIRNDRTRKDGDEHGFQAA